MKTRCEPVGLLSWGTLPGGYLSSLFVAFFLSFSSLSLCSFRTNTSQSLTFYLKSFDIILLWSLTLIKISCPYSNPPPPPPQPPLPLTHLHPLRHRRARNARAGARRLIRQLRLLQWPSILFPAVAILLHLEVVKGGSAEKNGKVNIIVKGYE